jgi:hypothetical protein
MKNPIIGSFVIVAALLTPQLVQAQGTLYFSNLGLSSSGSIAVGNDQWIGLFFGAGSASRGYTLNSIQILMNPSSGNPNGFNASIYSIGGSANNHFPGSRLGGLNGSDPAAGGVFTYTSSGLTLLPLDEYCIVLTAATPVASGSYNLSYESSGMPYSTDRWVPGFSYSSSDGSNWTFDGNNYQFAINATAIPEPSPVSLILLGSGILFYVRRRK